MEQTTVEFKEQIKITETEAKEWLEKSKAERYLEKIFPELKENQILIVIASVNGHGSIFFIKKVKDQKWFSSYLAKGSFYSKEFYIMTM